MKNTYRITYTKLAPARSRCASVYLQLHVTLAVE